MVKKRRLCAIFANAKTTILPRQARDKHKENSKNVAFSLGVDGSGDFTMRLNVNGAKIW